MHYKINLLETKLKPVSQIVIFTLFPPASIIFTLKSTPRNYETIQTKPRCKLIIYTYIHIYYSTNGALKVFVKSIVSKSLENAIKVFNKATNLFHRMLWNRIYLSNKYLDFPTLASPMRRSLKRWS